MLRIPTRISSLEWLGKRDICCKCQHAGTRIWLVLQTLWWLLLCGTWCCLWGCKIYVIIRLSHWSELSHQFCRTSLDIFASALSVGLLLAIVISAWVSVPFSNVAVAYILSKYCGGEKNALGLRWLDLPIFLESKVHFSPNLASSRVANENAPSSTLAPYVGCWRVDFVAQTATFCATCRNMSSVMSQTQENVVSARVSKTTWHVGKSRLSPY
jgi:hypothetical protein